MPPSNERFVVLEHRQPADQIAEERRRFLGGSSADLATDIDIHFDLMLENDGQLATWALPMIPKIGEQCPALLLPKHRIDFLDYEGPVSRGRGTVKRVMSGHFSGDEFAVRLIPDGLDHSISIAITKQNEAQFLFRFS